MIQKSAGKYKGWDVWTIENQWIKLQVAPDLGGRIIQLEMNGYEFFFNNPLLEGYNPGETRLGTNGSWLNFGGEKIWPAPQGWDSPTQWPGPPDPVLDSGSYPIANSGQENGFLMVSPFDQYTGLQIDKEVFLSDKSSEVSIRATFSNKSKEPVKWSVWPVCQMNTPGSNIENQYQIVCPVNPKSIFTNGYKVLHGLANNPQYQTDSYGNLVVGYQYLVGKAGLDASSNWLAFLDKKAGKVFALFFQYDEGGQYPDNTSVQIWTQGRGNIYSRNRIIEFPNDQTKNPPYMEMEILSPLQEIEPGGHFDYEYRMLACSVPEVEDIKEVTPWGVIASPLKAHIKKNEILIDGKYGFFSEGIIKLQLYDSGNNTAGLYEQKVSPAEGAAFNLKIEKRNFNQETGISAGLFDMEGHFVKKIEKISLNNRI